MRPLLALLLLLPAAASAQQQCSLVPVVTALEESATVCSRIPPQLTQLRGHLDSLSTSELAYLDSALASFRTDVLAQLGTVEVIETSSSGSKWPLILGIAGTTLGAAALIVALAHHHHTDVETNLPGDSYINITVERPGFCWPPGHCKGNK
ncbi:MAG: hypothetical protein AMS20_00180 [Gemmatimonas sp. SG8_28]|nr:MAG: hypothetical protein AMS20_00180 [Gemmatimonas sp. SG8_28]